MFDLINQAMSFVFFILNRKGLIFIFNKQGIIIYLKWKNER